MTRLILVLGLLTLWTSMACAQHIGSGSGGGNSLTVKENDNVPSVAGVNSISFTNGTVTDNGSGSVSVAITGTGAPTDATYLTQTANGTLTNEQALGLLTSGCMGVTTTTGVVNSAVITGTTNQITVTNGNCLANPVISIPTNPILPGTTTGTFSGNLTGNVTGTASSATALAADPTDCSAGSATTGINTSGTAQGCTDYMEEPAGNGFVARTAANTSANRTLTGTANQISVANGDGSGVPTFSLSSTLVLPGAQVDFTETAGDGTCAAGDYWIKANSTTTGFRKCQNGTLSDLDTGGGGSIGGSTGATDNAVLRADGVGGATAQSSGCTISDAGLMTCSGGFASTTGTGVLVLSEGTAPGAGTNAGEHNLYFNSGGSTLESHENGGIVQTYVRRADNLSVMAATSSTQLAGVLNDESGSSGVFTLSVGATHTTPTINTPTFGGSAPTLADGVTWTFNPNGTSAGLNIGSHTAAPSVPNNGDMWYDSTANKYKCRENGVTVDCISTGAGSGDITDVVAGPGIAVATPGGPAPTVSWNPITQVDNVSMWDGANASRNWTANLSGATDPVITFSDATVNVSTGALQVGGVAVSTADSTTTFTNKGLDCEGTGNTCTIPRRIWLPAAGCNNATAGSIWDLPTSAPAVAACVTGTNTQKGVLDFADASDLSAQITWKLPSTWTGTVDANIKWFSATTTGDVVWQIQTICVADAETDDPAFNTASTVTDTAKGTTNQTNDAAITGVTTTGCAAGELMHIKIRRDAGHASDNHAATARLIGVELVIREAI